MVQGFFAAAGMPGKGRRVVFQTEAVVDLQEALVTREQAERCERRQPLVERLMTWWLLNELGNMLQRTRIHVPSELSNGKFKTPIRLGMVVRSEGLTGSPLLPAVPRTMQSSVISTAFLRVWGISRSMCGMLRMNSTVVLKSSGSSFFVFLSIGRCFLAIESIRRRSRSTATSCSLIDK